MMTQLWWAPDDPTCRLKACLFATAACWQRCRGWQQRHLHHHKDCSQPGDCSMLATLQKMYGSNGTRNTTRKAASRRRQPAPLSIKC